MNFKILLTKEKRLQMISIIVALAGLIIPYYFTSGSLYGFKLSNSSLGGPLLFTGWGFICLIFIAAAAYCVMVGQNFALPVAGVVCLFAYFKWNIVFAYGLSTRLGAWVFLIGGLMLTGIGGYLTFLDYKSGNLNFRVFSNSIVKIGGSSPVMNNAMWSCPKCGTRNNTNFCSNCGEKKPTPQYAQPVQSDIWVCPNCGAKNRGNVCGACGNPKQNQQIQQSVQQAQQQIPIEDVKPLF